MMQDLSQKIHCWVITEGIAGTENQCLGVAEALGVAPEIKRIRLRQPWKSLSPYLGLEQSWSFDPELKPHWPDLVIASGRKSIAASRYIKKNSNKTLTVQIQDPRIDSSQFDLVAVPAHDPSRGDNVLVTTAAPNRITDKRLREARALWAAQFEDLPSPRVAVLIGGNSKAYKLTKTITDRLAKHLSELDASLMITTSRRTGKENEDVLRNALADKHYFWNGEGDNPYFGMLAWADFILVTADSASMLSEACTTGKPVYMIGLEGGHPRIDTLHKNLKSHGALKTFEGKLESWAYTPLNDSAVVAEEIKKRLNL